MTRTLPCGYLSTLPDGTVVCINTDGVLEARPGKEFFGEERLRASLQALRDRTAGEIAGGLASEVLEFQEGLPRDDIAIVAFKVIEGAGAGA